MAQKFLLVIDDKTYSDYMNGVIDRLVPEFRMDNVAYHRQLLNEPLERALGGGVYEFSEDRKTLLLSDKSYDYGIPQWHRVDAITFPKDTKLPSNIIYKYPKWEYPYAEDVDVVQLIDFE